MMSLRRRWRGGRQGTADKLSVIAKLPLFEDLGPGELRFLATQLDEVQVPAGQELIREDRHNDAFWVLLEGEAELSVAGGPGRRIGPGGFFGATSMLDGRPAVATVVSRTPLRALVASPEQFRALEGNQRVVLRLMAHALERLRADLDAQKAVGAGGAVG